MSDTVRKSIPAAHVVAVVLGNGLEFYDFLTYALFAVYIGKTFFPAQTASGSLLLSLATFGVGFVTRPIGGMVLGPLGDRIGRKPVMLISFALIGIAMLGLALTPGYAQIGAAAPFLVLFFRLIQGFALGGEVGPATAYLIEAAPPERRGFYGSMQYASQEAAILTASLVGLGLATVLSPHDLQAWGWRVAFLLGVVIVPFGIYIRRSLPETLPKADDAALAPDATTGAFTLRVSVRPYRKVIVLGFILLASTTIGVYVRDYITTYALDTLHMSAKIAFGVSVVSSLCAMCAVPVSGLLSDRFGRKPVMLIPAVLTLLAILPVFAAIVHFRSVAVLYGLMSLLSVFFALSVPPIIITLTESLPARIRAGTVATVYAFAISVFGGSTQFVITAILKLTGDSMAPAYYWATALLFGIVAIFFISESAPLKRK